LAPGTTTNHRRASERHGRRRVVVVVVVVVEHCHRDDVVSIVEGCEARQELR
jgi:hypothetical protein